ncbi:MAG TPA: hypothetical protein PKY05_16620, partial [Fibrobacteria bacterium]|nr:hypothetical protein [Fibrobacteria bacterium]
HVQTELGYLDGIRFGGTFQTGTMREEEQWATIPVNTFDVATKTPTSDLALMTVQVVDKQYSRELCYGMDTKIGWKKILLQAEWNHRTVLNLMDDRKATDFNGWYVLLSRNFPIAKNLEVAPYAMHESIGWTDGKNNPALELVAVPMEGFQTWVVGLNFGIYTNVRLKLEYGRVEMEKLNISSGDLANTYTDSDLAFDDFEAQVSVAF